MPDTFVPMLTIPATDDPYFVRKSYPGGLSPCIQGSPLYATGSALANCVAWCWGAAAKREQNVNCDIGFARGCTWPDNAWKWINHPNGRTVSYNVPQLGAIACWIRNDGLSGHVATIEQINADGSCLCSESGIGMHNYFRTVTYRGDGSGGLLKTNMTFQGYIYLNWPGDPPLPPSGDEDVLYPIAIGDRVRIIGKGRAASDGQGGIAYGIGWVRYVTGIYEEGQYPFRVGRLNGGTTGYYKADALEVLERASLKIGDTVLIKKAGNSRSNGTGLRCGGIGWERKIINILPGSKYPYRIGKDGRTTGYYTAAALEKI